MKIAAHIAAVAAFLVIALTLNGAALIAAVVLTILGWSLAVILLDVEVEDHRG